MDALAPVRYSYRTVNNENSDAAPAKPSWMLLKKSGALVMI